MMRKGHATPICGGIKHLCLNHWSTSGVQNRWLGGESQLNQALCRALSTINAVQEPNARNEGLAMMRKGHAMPICGGIKHLWLTHWSTSGVQNRWLGGESQLNQALCRALSTIIFSIVCYYSNVGGLDLILPGALAFLCAPWSIRSRSTLFFFASDGLKGNS